MEDPRIIVENEINEINHNFGEDDQIGPLELNLIERVEQGLNVSDGSESKIVDSKSDVKYNGPKEIIFVSGWANINTIYQQYLQNFIIRILLGIFIIISIEYFDQSLIGIAGLFCFISFFYAINYLIQIKKFETSNYRVKQMFIIELSFHISYLIYFVGFLLFLTSVINQIYLPLFVIPHVIISLMILFYKPKEALFIQSKKFAFLESIQLLLIAFKFAFPRFLNWNYVLIMVMGAAVYLFVLGILMSIILSCCLFGFLYRDIEQWKVKSLIWMTWYYLWTGIIYIYIIKGIIMFYGANKLFEDEVDTYADYQSAHYQMILVAAFLMVICSFVNLILHNLWKKEIQRYLAKVIYKNELRKEITMRILSKSFTFKLIQVSSTYFMKKEEEQKQVIKIDQKKIENISIVTSKKDSKMEQFCVFCYDQKPNILIDPCCHGGICQSCVVNYLKNDEGKCPFCKQHIEKLFILEKKEQKGLIAVAEIKFKK